MNIDLEIKIAQMRIDNLITELAARAKLELTVEVIRAQSDILRIKEFNHYSMLR